MKLTLNRKLILVLFCLLIGTTLRSQSLTMIQKDSSGYATIGQLLSRMGQKSNIHFFYSAAWFKEKKFPLALVDLSLEEFLIRLKRLTGYSCMNMGEGKYVFVPSEAIMSTESNQNRSSVYVVGDMNEYGKNKKATFSGKVIDGKSGDPLVGAILMIEKQKISVTTDHNGAFSVVLPVGDYDIRLRYIGYRMM